MCPNLEYVCAAIPSLLADVLISTDQYEKIKWVGRANALAWLHSLFLKIRFCASVYLGRKYRVFGNEPFIASN